MPLLRILFLIVLVHGTAYAQEVRISGTVTDRQTHEPLPGAHVYINQTSFVTITNAAGQFELTKVAPGAHELKISFVGYETETKKIVVAAGEDMVISTSLQPVQESLSEIEIKSSRDKEWERQFKKFNLEFLGDGRNAKKCKIVNPWVVDFVEVKSGPWQMKASSQIPIEVENSALGYKVFFRLIRFEVYTTAVVLLGDVRYEEMVPASPKEAKTWEEARMKAYIGSDRHFFKSLIDGNPGKQGFTTYAEREHGNSLIRTQMFAKELVNRIIPYSLVILSARNKVEQYRIPIPGRIEVHFSPNPGAPFYSDNPDQVSWVEASDGILCSAEGVCLEPAKVVMLGAWAGHRVADMLPLNYVPKK